MNSGVRMNIYKCLNEITKYIDDNLEEEIDYHILAKMLGTNVYTLQRLFTLITGISLSEYIRKRRLSNAGYDLYEKKLKIMDIADRYNYDNPISFSRAFYKFHGIKPSSVNKKTKLKNFPRIVFNENISFASEMDYEIVNLEKMDLYGVSIATNNDNIGREAPLFFKQTRKNYVSRYGEVEYGMITYDVGSEECQKYYCLYSKKIEGFEHIIIPKSKWLKFRINSQKPTEIQQLSHKFYSEFLPSAKYHLKELPRLEYYHDGVTDFLVAIY